MSDGDARLRLEAMSCATLVSECECGLDAQSSVEDLTAVHGGEDANPLHESGEAAPACNLKAAL